MSGASARARRAAAGGAGAGGARPAAPAAGPVVAVCTGHRCAGLRRLAGAEVLDDGLRAAVRASAGGVLISCPCLGRCEHGPVTVVGHHDGAAARATAQQPGGTEPAQAAGPGGPGTTPARTPMVWLRESPDPAWRAALRAWVARGAEREPTVTGAVPSRPAAGVPSALRAAVVGHSLSSPLRRVPEPPDTPTTEGT